MIKKNRQGRVVTYADESIFPSRQARKNAASPGGACEVREGNGSFASENEIELEHEAAVLKASEDSKAATGAEMARLQARVAELDAVSKKAREAAKQKLKSTKDEVEQIRRMAAEQAEYEYENVLDCIRSDFHAAVAPISAEAAEVLARQKVVLSQILSNLDEVRKTRLLVLTTIRILSHYHE